ncbi:hypothetical protein SAMN00777080_0906 [Aquiflexum balticum DSM 16537]|uniref:Uncharacterized protein n=1 Tax=Aquiflexum balticum DSM 16537 TaxID=758820 RepID=A0A1W2H0D2_9BACT|nr:DUF6557 family protein [Aquiflexum balticum]SMD42359.1 hypothetical protein SAMN00777080_0906 [Aquiflexum balticum DSM 16537]
MKLYDLIKSNNWFSIELTLLKLYPDQDKMLDEYRNVYEKLKITDPADYDELEIILTEYDCDPNFESEKETYVDVSGQKKIPDPTAITNSYAIEFLEWDKWLGMDLAVETIKNFSDLEIIAHSLYEMTYIDYDEETFQEQLKSLNDTVEEYKKLTQEEKKQKTISLDELKRRLDEKKGSS